MLTEIVLALERDDGVDDRVLALADGDTASLLVPAVAQVARLERAHAEREVGGAARSLIALLDYAEHADPRLAPGLRRALDHHRIELACAVEQLLFLVEWRIGAAVAVLTGR